MRSTALRFYHLAYEPAPALLCGTLLRQMSAQELTEAGELMLGAARHQHCPYWLLDGRRQQQHQPLALHQWLQEEYFPRAWGALGQQPCVAYLASADTMQRNPVRHETLLQEWHTPVVRLAWFAEPGPARAWLDRCRVQ